MNLSPYVQTVRDGVTQAAALADDHTRDVAERLGGSLEASTRLALISALSDAASTISAELAPSSVEVRMSGQDPEFHVSVPRTESEPTMISPPIGTESANVSTEDVLIDVDDEPVARISLRLPQSVKAKVDEVAAADGISTNAWLTRAVMDALVEAGRPPLPPRPPAPGPIFGPDGPFGAHGVFGPHGPFGMFRGGGAVRLDEPHGGRPPGPHGPGRPGRVQGWVR